METCRLLYAVHSLRTVAIFWNGPPLPVRGKPIFLNLPALEPERLVSAGGTFGRVLRLVQGRKASPGEFRRLVEETVAGLAGIAEAERLRWLELLSYIHMLV